MNDVVSSRNDNYVRYQTNRFEYRRKKHDEIEEEVMNTIRPYTNRRHLPDRWIAFKGKLCAWDMKTNIFVEDKSRDEYFRVYQEDKIPVFIVYQSGGEKFANWIQELTWKGPLPPSKNSTCNDPYYIVSGGVPLQDFLEKQR
jgi:hypothetical protein